MDLRSVQEATAICLISGFSSNCEQTCRVICKFLPLHIFERKCKFELVYLRLFALLSSCVANENLLDRPVLQSHFGVYIDSSSRPHCPPIYIILHIYLRISNASAIALFCIIRKANLAATSHHIQFTNKNCMTFCICDRNIWPAINNFFICNIQLRRTPFRSPQANCRTGNSNWSNDLLRCWTKVFYHALNSLQLGADYLLRETSLLFKCKACKLFKSLLSILSSCEFCHEIRQKLTNCSASPFEQLPLRNLSEFGDYLPRPSGRRGYKNLHIHSVHVAYVTVRQHKLACCGKNTRQPHCRNAKRVEFKFMPQSIATIVMNWNGLEQAIFYHGTFHEISINGVKLYH